MITELGHHGDGMHALKRVTSKDRLVSERIAQEHESPRLSLLPSWDTPGRQRSSMIGKATSAYSYANVTSRSLTLQKNKLPLDCNALVLACSNGRCLLQGDRDRHRLLPFFNFLFQRRRGDHTII
jgi:hypothetical protein